VDKEPPIPHTRRNHNFLLIVFLFREFIALSTSCCAPHERRHRSARAFPHVTPTMGDNPPCPSIYINNLNEKIKKDGARLLVPVL
jgi:hypothetical protein